MCRLADGFAALKGAGRSFRLHIHHDLGLLALNELGGFLIAEHFSPRLLEANHFAALAAAHLGHAVAKETIGERRNLGAWLNQIADGGFHAATAGGGNDERHLVLGAKHAAQHPLNVRGNFKEIGVEMADDRLGHCLINPGMHLAWTGAVQKAFRRMDRNSFHERRFFCGANH